MRYRLIGYGVLAVGIGTFPVGAEAGDAASCGFDEKQRLGGGPSNYGYSSALSADHSAVGSLAGTVDVYRRDDQGTPSDHGDDEWVYQTRLAPALPGQYYDGFGRSIDLHGPWLITGARYDDLACPEDADCNAGAAHLYRLDDMATPSDPVDDTWVLHAILTAPDAAEFDEFGVAVALTEEWAIVGAHQDDEGCPPETGCSTGSVYLFKRDDGGTADDLGDDVWSFETKLNADDATFGHQFGTSLATDGTRLAVGAYARAVYLFHKSDDGSQWVQEASLVSDSASNGFARSIAIDAGFVVAGAPYTDLANADYAGAAFVYRHDSGADPNDPADDAWIEQVRLTAESPVEDDRFGYDVAISAGRIVVGVLLSDDHCSGGTSCNSGAAYVYAHDDRGSPLDPSDDVWTLEVDLYARFMGFGDTFGSAVSIQENVILIGAMEQGHYLYLPGRAYLFTNDVDCNGNGAQDGCDLLDGTSADCDENRTPDECDIAAGRQRDCDASGVVDRCEIWDGIHADCDSNSVPDVCDLADPEHHDCNANGLVDACEYIAGEPGDCNYNRIPDECDVASGVETDCDANSLPDSCEIVDDGSRDCNDDGMLDLCLTAEMDCNANVIPDDCEHLTPLLRIPLGDEYPHDQNEASVDIDETRLVVGSIPWEQPEAAEQVLVYRRDDRGTPGDPDDDEWLFEAALEGSDAGDYASFGFSTAVHGRRVVVGAPWADVDGVPSAGAAYVFVKSDNGTPLNEDDDLWLEETKLTAPAALVSLRFGTAVDIDENLIVVTAPSYGSGDRSAYVFRRTDFDARTPADESWVLEATLTGQASGDFGAAVALHGNRLAVTSPWEENAEMNRGAAYVFQRDGGTPLGRGLDSGPWSLQARLTASSDDDPTWFGNSVAINHDRIVVGEAREWSIAAHVFRWVEGDTGNPEDGTWSWEAALVIDYESVDHFDELFSPFVAASGDRVLLGGIRNYPYYVDGTAYAFRLDDNGTPLNGSDDHWFSEGALGGSIETQDEDMFGVAGAAASGFAVIRAGEYAGPMAAYVIALTADDCNRNGKPDDCDLAGGTSEDTNLNGLPDECETPAVFNACLAGPSDPPGSFWYRNTYECRRAFDLNTDGQVDLRDWAQWLTLNTD